MPKKVYLAIIVLAVLVVASVAAFYALQTPPATEEPTVTVKAGVKAGDTFTYSITGMAETGNDNVAIPSSFKELNQTDYYKITITNVEGPSVTYNSTWRFLNGTQFDRTETINVATGTDAVDFWAIYAANLTKGSLLRPAIAGGATVNETETRIYMDGNRTANVFSMSGVFYDSEDLTYTRTYNAYRYVHFDQQTGMLVELKEIKIYTDPEIMLTVDWNLVDSNVLQVS
jgi:hypothetical protein